jgi:hypothetical protein
MRPVGARGPLATALAATTCVTLVGVVGMGLLRAPAAFGATAAMRFVRATELVSDATGSGALAAVSCLQPSSCVAVGTDGHDHGEGASGLEAAGHWAWTAATEVSPDASGSTRLLGVSCPSRSSCMAVGVDGNADATYATGTAVHSEWTWSTATPVVPDSSGSGQLAAVSCPVPTSCVGVGSDSHAQGAVGEATRNGATWTWSTLSAIAPDAAGGGQLLGVSCPTATKCVAVGEDSHATGIYTIGSKLASAWTWSTAAPVTSDKAGGGRLTALSCPNSSMCEAVGTDANGQGTFATAIRAGTTWTWTKSVGVPPGPEGIAGLLSVSCPTTSSCVAAGADGSGHGVVVTGSPVGVDWRWTAVSPLVGGSLEGLSMDGIACGAAGSCVAVGRDGHDHAVYDDTVAAPQAPRSVAARWGDTVAQVSWSPPLFDGGAAITDYRVLALAGAHSCTVRAATASRLDCTVGNLEDGTRYTFMVTASNGAGVSVPSHRSNAVVPSNHLPRIRSPFTSAVMRFLASTASIVSSSLYDVRTGQTWTFRPGSEQHMASVVKVDILATLLHDRQNRDVPLPPATVELATLMIEDSDNDAATALFNEIGGPAGLASFNSLVGLTGIVPNYAWGFTDTTAADQVRLLRLFVQPNRVLDPASRRFGIGLMTNVTPSQAWGVSAGPPRGTIVALKDGWYPTEPGAWQINSIGWIDGHGCDYILAVITERNSSMTSGIDSVETLSRMLWANVNHLTASEESHFPHLVQ